MFNWVLNTLLESDGKMLKCLKLEIWLTKQGLGHKVPYMYASEINLYTENENVFKFYEIIIHSFVWEIWMFLKHRVVLNGNFTCMGISLELLCNMYVPKCVSCHKAIRLHVFKITLMQIWKSLYMFVLIQKQHPENFVFLILRILKPFSRKLRKIFVYKHSETMEYVKK